MEFKGASSTKGPAFSLVLLAMASTLLLCMLFVEGCGDEKRPEAERPKVAMAIKKPIPPSVKIPASEKKVVLDPMEIISVESKVETVPTEEATPQVPPEVKEGPSAQKVSPNSYQVQRGDSLSIIAGRQEVYGDSMKWLILFRHNLDKLGQMKITWDFQHRELPEGLQLKVISPNNNVESLEDLSQKSWVINVMSDKDPKKIVSPAVALVKNGYHPYLVRATIQGEDWIRLRVGFFQERSEALSEGRKIMGILNAKQTWAVKIGKEELAEFAGY